MFAAEVSFALFFAFNLDDCFKSADELLTIHLARLVCFEAVRDFLPETYLRASRLASLQVKLVERRYAGHNFFYVLQLVGVIPSVVLAISVFVFVPAKTNKQIDWGSVDLPIAIHDIVMLILWQDQVLNRIELIFRLFSSFLRISLPLIDFLRFYSNKLLLKFGVKFVFDDF